MSSHLEHGVANGISPAARALEHRRAELKAGDNECEIRLFFRRSGESNGSGLPVDEATPQSGAYARFGCESPSAIPHLPGHCFGAYATPCGRPIDASRYNRAHGLTAAEHRFLAVELPSRIKVGRPRKTALDVVQRLVHPLHDVFDHIEFNGPKRRSLLLHLLEEMGRRNRAFWGWTEEEWIDVVECRRYDGNRIIAAAFLLRGGFAALSSFPKGRQVYSCLVCRVFGPKAVAETERQVKAGLRDLGYRARTLRIMPLTLAQLLLIVRSPRLEDITESALLQLQEQNGTVALRSSAAIHRARALGWPLFKWRAGSRATRTLW